MLLAKRLDARAAVVHRIVAVAGATYGGGDDSQIRRSRRRMTTCALQDQRYFFERAAHRWSRVGISVPSTTHDSRRSRPTLVAPSAASRGVIVETIRCAADFEIAKLAAISRIQRLVRSVAHVIKTRCASERDQGRPRRGSGGRRRITDASRWREMAASTSARDVVMVLVRWSWLLSQDRCRVESMVSSEKRTRGPNQQTPWVRPSQDGVSLLRLALDTSDPLQRGRVEAMFRAAYCVRRAVQRDARDGTRAYWAAAHERDRDPGEARDRLGLSRTALEHAAYAHLDAAPHLRRFVTKALAMHLADSVWAATERHLFVDARGKRHGTPRVSRWHDFTRLPGRALAHPRSGAAGRGGHCRHARLPADRRRRQHRRVVAIVGPRPLRGGKTPCPSQPTSSPARAREGPPSRRECPHPTLSRWLGELLAWHPAQPWMRLAPPRPRQNGHRREPTCPTTPTSCRICGTHLRA